MFQSQAEDHWGGYLQFSGRPLGLRVVVFGSSLLLTTRPARVQAFSRGALPWRAFQSKASRLSANTATLLGNKNPHRTLFSPSIAYLSSLREISFQMPTSLMDHLFRN